MTDKVKNKKFLSNFFHIKCLGSRWSVANFKWNFWVWIASARSKLWPVLSPVLYTVGLCIDHCSGQKCTWPLCTMWPRFGYFTTLIKVNFTYFLQRYFLLALQSEGKCNFQCFWKWEYENKKTQKQKNFFHYYPLCPKSWIST